MSLKLTPTMNAHGSFSWSAILYGTILAVITSVLLLAVGGTVMYYTTFNERLVPVFGLGIVFTSIFLGGLTSARKAGRLGWLHGLTVGIMFLILTILFNLAVPGGIFGFAIAKKVLASIIAGCLGGIWGVGQN